MYNKVHESEPFLFKFENKNNEMRYLFIILITSISFGQSKPKDLTELTIYHYYSPLQIAYYCDGFRELEIEEFSDYCSYTQMIKYYSTNEETVKKLYTIIQNGKKWRKEKLDTQHSFLGNGQIENRIIIKYNSFCDTIYTTKGNKSLIYKNSKHEYIDEQNQILKSFDNELKKFFNLNHLEKRENLEKIKNDSIDVNDIKINDKIIFKLSRENFEKDVSKFTNVITDSMDLFFLDQNEINISKRYLIIDSYFNFHENQLSHFSIKNDESFLDLLNFKIKNIEINLGDNLDKLNKYFENSTYKAIELKKIYNCNSDEVLSIEILFKDNKGKLYINSLNNKIFEITGNFEY